MVFPNFALKTRVACDMSPKPQRATSVLIGSFDERRVRAASELSRPSELVQGV